ncbi:MAG TPA: hypothetical protein VK557_18740 [Pyrinomonadaceae bacterium]|nr:hypothetical protein [Pyrinomonadaceae bacterium]
MSLREELEQIDGDNGSLELFLTRRRSKKSFVNQLVLLITPNEPTLQIKATALLKRLAENEIRFTRPQLAAILDLLAEVTHWEAKLHLCQTLQHVEIPKGSETKVVWFLERCLAEENKFLRAWAYNGFYELAKQHHEYYDYAMEQLERAQKEKSAAVKARLRNIMKAMNHLAVTRPSGRA